MFGAERSIACDQHSAFQHIAQLANISGPLVGLEPSHRGAGIGKRLLAAVAQAARERDSWMQWLVLDWNEPAIEFYRRLGAVRVEEWDSYRLEGEALARVAGF